MKVGLKSAVVGMAALALLCTSSGAAYALLSGLAPGSDAQKAAVGCVRAIVKETAKYQAAALKNVQKCKGVIVQKGAVASGYGNLGNCANIGNEGMFIPNVLANDLRVKTDASRDKMRVAIAGKCCGKDKLCGVGTGDNADLPLGDINWSGGSCQEFENSGCESIAITNGDHIGDCLACQIDYAIEQIADDIVVDPLLDSKFGAASEPGKTHNACQQTVVKEAYKFLTAKRKTLLKCQDKKYSLAAGFNDPIRCPDTDPGIGGTGFPKTVEAILKTEQKLAAAICKKCGGVNDANKDGICDTPVPGYPSNHLDGLATCPLLELPPSGSGILDAEHRYGTDCGAIAVTSLQGWIDCITCVAEYKADCLTHAAYGNVLDAPLGINYPSECEAPLCGNGVVDGGNGEDCDINAPNPQCPNAGNGLQDCNPDCTCSCPSTVTFAGDALNPASALDTGWTGKAHDAKIIDDGLVTVTLTCPDPYRDPSCGVCAIAGPIANPDAGAGQIDSQRCRLDRAVQCTADSQCPGAGNACVIHFGAPLPLSAGGTPSCIINEFAGPIAGTANIETGTSANTVSLISQVHLGVSAPAKPCHNCIGDTTINDGVKGGTCDGGVHGAAFPCDVMGVSPIPAFNGGAPAIGKVNGTSLDCTFVESANSGRLPINLSNSTGTEAVTVSATGPTCTAAGFGGLTCGCDTCATLAGEPCNEDADCPGGGPGSCGGLRCLGGGSAGTPCTIAGLDPICGPGPCGTIGQPTQPHGCTGGMPSCSPVGGGEGMCPTGPFVGRCTPVETFRECLASSECPQLGDTCVFLPLECFVDNGIVGGAIVAIGAPDLPVNDASDPTLGSAFCIAPTGSSTINAAAGLPGAGRVTLSGNAQGLP